MNKWQSAGVIIVFLCMGMGKLCAQSDDLGLWVSAEVKKKIFPGLDAFLEGEFRLRDNLRAVDRWGGTAGLSYRLFPFLKASAGYLIFITIIRIKRPRGKLYSRIRIAQASCKCIIDRKLQMEQV